MNIEQHSCFVSNSIYPAIFRAVRPPPQNSAEAKKLGGGSTARKSPIDEGWLKFHFIAR